MFARRLYAVLLPAMVCLFTAAAPVSAEEVVIVFTGETHAMIYPCSCPVEPDGGIARRAAFVRKFRAQNPQMLLLDSGGVFGGGLMDEYSQSSELDQRRTDIAVRAISLMKYDAVAVGDDEFNFGREYFSGLLAKYKIPFISSNCPVPGVAPFVIKRAGKVSVGIVGVSPQSAGPKAGGIIIPDAAASVRQAIERMKARGADLIVLLSHLGETEDKTLLRQVKGIDILIAGHMRGNDQAAESAGSTLIVRPSWQGRKIGIVRVQIGDDKRIRSTTVEEERLSDEVADDAEVAAFLPACFMDRNCKRNGQEGTCRNPAEPRASCVFDAVIPIKVTVISSKDCLGCQPEQAIDSFKRVYPGVTAEYIWYPRDARAKKLVKDLEIKTLPVYLFDKSVEREKHFEQIRDRLQPVEGYYMLKPEFSGVAFFLQREKKTGAFEVFLNLQDGASAAIFALLGEFRPKVHFIAVKNEQNGYDTPGGALELEENLRGVCVQKYYPGLFWNYMSCRSANMQTSWWDDCLPDSDKGVIKTCAQGREGRELLDENIRLNEELGITSGPAYFVNNQQVFSTKGAPDKEQFRMILKEAK